MPEEPIVYNTKTIKLTWKRTIGLRMTFVDGDNAPMDVVQVQAPASDSSQFWSNIQQTCQNFVDAEVLKVVSDMR